MIRVGVAGGLLLVACGGEPPPRPDDEVSLVYPLSAVGTEGRAPLLGGDLALIGWELDEEGEWRSRAGVLDAARQELWIEGPDGERPELVVPHWGIRPGRPTVRLPAETLAPGTWTWHVQVDGEDFGDGTFEITEHGQVDGFDPEVLDGTLWALDRDRGDSQEWFGPTGQEHLLEPLYVRVETTDDGVDLMAYSALLQSGELCRVWSGSGQIDAGGFLSATAAPSLDGPLAVQAGELRMSVLDGREAIGLGFEATVEVSALDAAVTGEEETVEEGAACDFLEGVGIPCEPCPSGDSDDCVTVRTFSGVPESLTEAEVLGRFEGSPATLDQVPPCDRPEQSSVSLCSVLGTAGMGAWFFGVGALLLRRRRASPPPA